MNRETRRLANQETRRRVEDLATDNGWDSDYRGRTILQKDGYEIFIDGPYYELTIRDPETRERKTITSSDNITDYSPLYVAYLQHIIEHAENIVTNVEQNSN